MTLTRDQWRHRALQAIAEAAPDAGEHVPPGFWNISGDVWVALNDTGALDSMEPRSVPLLHGRPLIRCDAGPACCSDLLAFEARSLTRAVGRRYA